MFIELGVSSVLYFEKSLPDHSSDSLSSSNSESDEDFLDGCGHDTIIGHQNTIN